MSRAAAFVYLPMFHDADGDRIIAHPQATAQAAYACIIAHAAGRSVDPLPPVSTTGELAEDVAFMDCESEYDDTYSIRALILPA